MPTLIDLIGTLFFVIAVIHTFSAGTLKNIGLKFPNGSVGRNFFQLMGEVEVAFGLWAGIMLAGLFFVNGYEKTFNLLENTQFAETLFVFVIMTIAATRPISHLVESTIHQIVRVFPFSPAIGFYWLTLVLGPLTGSFITEPAAMTVTAILLRDQFFHHHAPERFKYATLGILFVNISIGGALSPFAAPPILMVAGKWNWDFSYMISHFGWKALLAILINTTFATWFSRPYLKIYKMPARKASKNPPPIWVQLSLLLFLTLVVIAVHEPFLFLGIFFFFLGFVGITRSYQEPLKLKESALVTFFLGGLVILGNFQTWWITPFIQNLHATSLYLGVVGLTSIVDNAALTYLGSLIPNLTDATKYVLVAGTIAGGGLTVIANAPNPIGFTLLQSTFGPGGIRARRLLKAALLPTCVALACFWFL